MTTYERLQERIATTHLCVGLDPRPERMSLPLETFLRSVIEETAPYVAAYKANSAYFEVYGETGWRCLERLRDWIPADIPLIYDCKRSDIPETQTYYARAAFEVIRADAVTVNPYMGKDSLLPFCAYKGKLVYVLVLTSNDGAQDIQFQQTNNGRMYDVVRNMIVSLQTSPAALGAVVGLTKQLDLSASIWQEMPLLLPGLGAQGGALPTGCQPSAPWLINVSRAILFPEGNWKARALAFREKIQSVFNEVTV